VGCTNHYQFSLCGHRRPARAGLFLPQSAPAFFLAHDLSFSCVKLESQNYGEDDMPGQKQLDITQQIKQLEKEIQTKKKQVVELKHNLGRREVKDYTFNSWDGSEVPLADLFGDRDELILIHNMGKRCAYCTLWADGLNGFLPHLENRAAFVMASPDDPETQKEFAESRGWQLKMVSYGNNSFAKEMGFLGDKNDYWPGVSTFVKDADGKIYRSAWSYFGPGDDFCSVWPLFDLLAKGTNSWEPQFNYK
jgi:predicted dithiol-disulfide oxidoreductase (DUF899 family)